MIRGKLLLIGIFAVAALGNGCATNPAATPAAPVPTATTSNLSPEKLALRNNAASLLFQLVEDEKNVSVLLVIKGEREDVGNLVKAISATADQASKNLTALAQADPSLNLHTVNLPVGELAVRAAIAKTKTHQLLLSGGENFEFALLLTQADALGYGYHLAGLAADNSANATQKETFTALRDTMKKQYQQVIALIRGSGR